VIVNGIVSKDWTSVICEKTTSGLSREKISSKAKRNFDEFLNGDPGTQFMFMTLTFGGMISEEYSPVSTVSFLKCGANFRTTPI
jgi:hypothetical protein